jgi:ACR3 family arsenite transporter
MATPAAAPKKRLAFFERYLTVWVLICMAVGVAFGKLLPGGHVRVEPTGVRPGLARERAHWRPALADDLSDDAQGGFQRHRRHREAPKGLMVTLFVNWLVKPFSMALLAWLFMQHVFAHWIDPETAKNYTAGLIILAAAPCTAMVFVWSYLTDGDPVYTLVQVAVNDLIMLVAFAPIVMFLCGVANVIVPPKVLMASVVVFIVIPLTAGWLTRTLLLQSRGQGMV